MKDMQYITDDSGDRTSVVIDIKKHGDLWVDFYNNMINMFPLSVRSGNF